MYLADRTNRLGTETAFEVLARARALEAQGKSIIHLEIGEPDFDTPRHIIEAAHKALDEGWTHYGPASGDINLKEAIVDEIKSSRNIDIGVENVVVTPGAKPIMFFGILSCVEEGDEVIYPNPGFPIYESMINFIGAKPVPLTLREEKDFSFEIDELSDLINDKTRMIIINSPQNPTGGVLSLEDLEQIASLVAERDIIVMTDEVYSRMVYDGEHHSILSLDGMKEKTILIEGFSKTYAMTGWRLGYGVMPENVADMVSKFMVNSNSCTASFTQRAGIQALTGSQEDSENMIAEFKERKSVIVDGMNSIPGISCRTPKGAFYVFPNIKETGMTSEEAENKFLNDAGVACLKGTSFGANGEGYIRFSYANSKENIREALERIERVLTA
ncbi:MAG: pyridoxal phosphate-dependent aminotransferase [Candidatus Marinimicrobia bacterium]|nr:pyridoxal phosphate-dependent aminotransferase [Candidatus Neomarinimicrobiota bacterium]